MQHERESTPTSSGEPVGGGQRDAAGPGAPGALGAPGSTHAEATRPPRSRSTPPRPSPRRVLHLRRLARVPVCATSLPPAPDAVTTSDEAEAPEEAPASEGPSMPDVDVRQVVEALGARVFALDDLADDERRVQEHGERLRVVRAMLRGSTASDALRDAGLEGRRTTRWAQKLYARWKETGSVLDGRITRVPTSRVLTTEIKALILLKWNGRRKANARAVWRMVRDQIQALRTAATEEGRAVELVEPQYETVKKFLAQLPKSLHLVRDGGMAAWTKLGRPFIDYEPSEYANHIAQIDHCRLAIWVRIEVAPGVWEARVVWITVVLDVHSRAVLGYQLSTRVPDQWTMALALRHAILKKDDPQWPMCGVPEVLVPDQGADFMSHAAARLAEGLGIRLEPTPPYYPDMKAEIERFFGTLNSFLSQLVGFMPADGRSAGAAAKRVPMLLTLQELRGEVARFLTEYHTRDHGGIGGEQPAARWVDTVRHLALPDTPEDLNVLLLKDDVVRTVTKGGIRFTLRRKEKLPPENMLPSVDDRDLREVEFVRGGRYWTPELMDYLGQEVRLRYNPEDLDSVLVYSATTGERLCEAWLIDYTHSRYTKEYIKRLRAGYRKGLRERTTAYVKEVERDDRRSAAERDRVRKLAQQLATGRAASASGTATTGAAAATGGTAKTGSAAKKAKTANKAGSAKTAGRAGAKTPKGGESREAKDDVADLVASMDRRARGKAG